MTPVGWGILGAGTISSVAVGPALAEADNCRVAAVAARDAQRARAVAPAARAYNDYAEAVHDPDVEVVYIALANDAHVPWAIEALRAGKHVLCEKPLGMDAAEVSWAYEEAERAGRLLVEASWYRWHPRTRRAEELLAARALGDVRSVSAGFTFEGVRGDNYRMRPEMGGGALFDVGCYCLSALGWATGWRPLQVSAVGGVASASGVDLVATAALRGDGVEASMRAAFIEAERQWIEVEGDAGSLSFGPPAFTAWTGDPTTLNVNGRVERFPACNPYRLMVEAVAAAVMDRPAWLVPPADSIATATLIDSIRLAAGWPVSARREDGTGLASP